MTINALSVKLALLKDELISFVRIAFEENLGKVMELQRIQLFSGKRADGDDIRPYYSEDLQSNGGYFKSAQSAAAYARMKATSIDYPINVSRQMDAPNLYINGRFHSELGAETNAEEIVIRGLTSYANRIIEKYGLDTFGLSDESMNELMPTIRDRVNEQLRQYIYG